MTNINKWVTPKNIQKPTETIYEIKDQVPSFEEFMKDYEADENMENSYADELESYDDIGIKKVGGPMYHAGSSSSSNSLFFSIKYKFSHLGDNRKNYFKQFGNYNNEWNISGSLRDIKNEQRKLEDGEIRVVRLNERGNYEINTEKEEEVKDKLRRDIRDFEKWRCGNPGRVEREFKDVMLRTTMVRNRLIDTRDCPGCSRQLNPVFDHYQPKDKDCSLQ